MYKRQIKVTVDDRLRDASGALTAGANGGATNVDGTPIDALALLRGQARTNEVFAPIRARVDAVEKDLLVLCLLYTSRCV